MTVSLYDLSVPVFLRGFASLAHILERGRAYAEEKGMPFAELTEARLIGDMLPLTGQIQRASDTAKFVPVRMAGVENVAMADTEVTFDDMQARIRKTVDFLQAVPASGFVGAEGRDVVVKTRNGELTYRGASYILEFALPNFFFHVTTAYDILRHKGVPLSKRDYLGGGR